MTGPWSSRLRALAPLAFVASTAWACSSSSSGAPATNGTPQEGGASDDASAGDASNPVPGDGGTPPSGDGSVSSAEGGSTDGGPADAGPTDGGACVFPPAMATPACFAFAATGPMVTTTCASGQPPQGQGGSIPNGEYVFQSEEAYGSCPSLPEMQTSILVCGDQWDVASASALPDGARPSSFRAAYTVTQQGSSITQVPTCSSDFSTATIQIAFTYAAGQLTLLSTATSGSGTTQYVDHYQKQ